MTVSTINAQQKLNPEIEKKIDVLMSKMTLEEKVGQMNQYNGFWDVTGPAPVGGTAEQKYENIKKGLVGSMLTVRGVKEVKAVQKIAVEQTRLGIPLIIGFDVIHGYKTLSPIPLAEAASWDLKSIEKSAETAASEAAASGINWTFGPMMDISKDARWGRVMEGAGEDPYLGSRIAEARVKGFQGEGGWQSLSDVATLLACGKHFAAYGAAESGRDYNTAELSEHTLRNVYLPPYQAALEAGVGTFMASFNEVNGVPATASRWLLTEPLDYAPMVALMVQADVLLTDSGGIQEEGASLHKPVLVLRNVTERPELIRCGAGKLVGTERATVVRETLCLLQNAAERHAMQEADNPFGDGKAAIRIAERLQSDLVDDPSSSLFTTQQARVQEHNPA